MKIIQTVELKVCTDCILLIANGEGDPALAAKIAEQWEGYQLVPGDGSEAFSWSPCEGCGSTLHGDRHGAAALREITVAERLEELRAEAQNLLERNGRPGLADDIRLAADVPAAILTAANDVATNAPVYDDGEGRSLANLLRDLITD